MTNSVDNATNDELREDRFRVAFEHSPIGMAITRPDGRLLEVNPQMAAMLGYDREELVGKTFQQLTHPGDLGENLDLLERATAGELDGYQLDKRYVTKGGSVVWAHIQVSVVRDATGRFRYMLTQLEDITTERRDEQFRDRLLELVEASLLGSLDETLFQRAVAIAVDTIPGAQAGSLLLREEGDRFRFAAAVGHDLEVLERLTLREHELYADPDVEGPHLVHDFGPQTLEDPVAQEVFGDGERMAVTLTIPLDIEGERTGYFTLDNYDDPFAFDQHDFEIARILAGQVGSLMARMRLEAKLRHQALHDTLTGLATRRLLEERIDRAIALAERGGPGFAVAMLDLDGFKDVNDVYGHLAGDHVLEEFARRLESVMRESDTAARFGGDEFALLLNNLRDEEDADAVLMRVLDVLADAFELGDFVIDTSVSLGFATYRPGDAHPEQLLGRADKALYEAKRKGKARFERAKD